MRKDATEIRTFGIFKFHKIVYRNTIKLRWKILFIYTKRI